VADSGCGIETGDLQRIFQRFARASTHRNREAGGFGLGLAIVQAIATAHGGSVKVHSAPGQGAIFEIFLPLVPADDAIASGQPAEPAAAPES
jgi:two-component system OmpR family sensor kinase